jgi:hypothetical protein
VVGQELDLPGALGLDDELVCRLSRNLELPRQIRNRWGPWLTLDCSQQ